MKDHADGRSCWHERVIEQLSQAFITQCKACTSLRAAHDCSGEEAIAQRQGINTPEPQTRVPAATPQSFELQRHAANLLAQFLTRWDLPGDHIDHRGRITLSI